MAFGIDAIKRWRLARLSAAQRGHAGVATVNNGVVCGPDGSPVSGAITGSFSRAASGASAWTLTGSALTSNAEIVCNIAGVNVRVTSGTAVTLPTHIAGADYAIHATADGRLVSSANWSAPTGEPANSTIRVGGYHYALDSEIAPYSLWDLSYRPACPDPRGMVRIGESGIWADIYLMGVNHTADGTSKAGVTIADGSSPPKIPVAYGGDGSIGYTNFTWFVAQDCLQAYGKRSPTWAEFSALAFGVTEATAVSVDPVATKQDAPRRSKWGVEQATGNMWVWGADVMANADASQSWRVMTGGRGSVYTQTVRAVILGGDWGSWASCGSRSASFVNSPSDSDSGIGARGVCDHYSGAQS